MHLLLAQAGAVRSSDGRVHPLAALDAALLAWLAVQGPTPRADLVTLLWPDSAPEAGRNSLRQRLFKLRQLVAGQALVTGSGTLALAAGVSHDLDDAESLLGQSEPAADGEFATWLQGERELRAARGRDRLAAQADAAEAAADWPAALAAARELLAAEPLHESAHRRLIRLHYLAGDRAAALQAFERCERVLRDELGVRPGAQTLALRTLLQRAGGVALAPGVPGLSLPLPAGVLRPPRCVGRERELQQLQQGWQAGHVVALQGEAGMGKTRLLQEFGATQPPMRYVAARPGDAGVPLATLARLLRQVVAVAPPAAPSGWPAATRSAIARVLPELDTATPRAAGEGQRLVLLRAVRELLQAPADGATVVVDDLHFADDASLDLLAGLLDGHEEPEPPGPPLRWLLAWRAAEAGSALQRLHDGLADQARIVAVRLAPLDEPALAALVDSLELPGVAGAALAPGLLRRTGGNPLFVLETLKQAWVERTLAQLADAAQLPRPLSVGRLIERRLAQLSPGALALARVAGVAGVDFGIELAEQVLGVPALQLSDALNELEAAQVLRGTAFAHDLVHDAVRDSVPQAIAQLTHARVAAWLAPRGGEPARVARHWLAGGRDDEALPWLLRAAERAGAALRRREQIGFLDEAARLQAALGRREDAFRTEMQAAEVEVTLDDAAALLGPRCDRLDALAGDDPVLRLRAAVQRCNAAEMRGFHDEAIAVGEAALRAALQAGVPAAETAVVRLGLATALSGAERPAEALVHFEAVVDWLREHGSLAERCELHGNLATTYGRLARLQDATTHHRIAQALAREAGDVANEAICLSNLASTLARAGSFDEADRLLEQSMRVMAQADEDSAVPGYIAIEQVVVHRQQLRLGLALQDVDRGLRHLERFAPGYCVVIKAHEAGCWAYLGQWARFEQAAAVLEGDASVPRVRLRLEQLRRLGDTALGRRRDDTALRHWLQATASDLAADVTLALRTDRALLQGDAVALQEIQSAARDAARLALPATELLAWSRAAALAATLGDGPAALQAAHAAWRLVPGTGLASLYPLEAWLACVRGFEAGGEPALARAVAQAAAALIEQRARDEVPEPFRESFRARNPVNQALLAAAARLGS